MNNINHIPDQDNDNVRNIIAKLNINSKPFYVEIKPEQYCLNGFCFENVKEKIRRDRGSIVFGWQFCEYPYMIEAMFHCVWKSPEGALIDVTPSEFPCSKTLFAVDNKGSNRTMPLDHCRLNITGNPVVDDMISLDEAFFRFKHSGERLKAEFFHELSDYDIEIWRAFEMLIADMEMFYYGNGKKTEMCFCNRGLLYEDCHGNLLKQLVNFY